MNNELCTIRVVGVQWNGKAIFKKAEGSITWGSPASNSMASSMLEGRTWRPISCFTTALTSLCWEGNWGTWESRRPGLRLVWVRSKGWARAHSTSLGNRREAASTHLVGTSHFLSSRWLGYGHTLSKKWCINCLNRAKNSPRNSNSTQWLGEQDFKWGSSGFLPQCRASRARTCPQGSCELSHDCCCACTDMCSTTLRLAGCWHGCIDWSKWGPRSPPAGHTPLWGHYPTLVRCYRKPMQAFPWNKFHQEARQLDPDVHRQCSQRSKPLVYGEGKMGRIYL